MGQTIDFSVNGSPKTVEIEGWEKLLDLLRDRLGLTGAKCGCDDFTCGTCTVVLNGKARKSCTVKAAKLQGAEVVTIEGVSEGYELHPIQRALIESGAVQCGFCTPGIVMELYALFNKNVAASREQIVDVLARHLCRCTGYEPILQGALLAQEYLQDREGK